ncbi:MAG: branched-chain amino acid transport system ATP-binding protein [Actinomycetota bacterium]|jgi:ABC-type branched-subunit amino acid transport system ATPase component|nr:branched-chain amino acid transport system ATP-binding protein [Actinomycetota bacterium]
MAAVAGAGLVLSGVSRDFAGVHAVVDVSLAVEAGRVVGVVGPNGSGKTTVVNLASGAVAPSGGRVVVDGVDLTGASSRRFAAAGVVRTFQALRLFEGQSVLANVLVGAQRRVSPSLVGACLRPPAFRRRERELADRARQALVAVGLDGFADRPVAALSHGQRRRVELARAVAASPSYLVLDEPAAGIDPEQAEVLMALIRSLAGSGCGVLVVEHDPTLVDRVCDRVVGMADGSVVASGTYDEVAAHPALVSTLPPLGLESR